MKKQFCLILLLISSEGLFAQNLLGDTVTVDWQKNSYTEALGDLEERYGVVFIYFNDLLPTHRLTYQDTTTFSVLFEKLFERQGLNYEISGKEVVLRANKFPQRPRHFTIRGKIRDRETEEELIGVNIWLEGTKQGTTTNYYGFYSLTLPQGIYKLNISYLGYELKTFPVQLDSNIQLDVQLDVAETQLKEVVIMGEEEEDINIQQLQTGTVQLSGEVFKKVPFFLGEPDVIKTLQLLPGVQSITEGSAGFFVRGGGADQNLILIDEAPVFNASHFGLFSIFNPDAVKEITFAKGGIPARYGGRLSSVLDVRLREGNYQQMELSGGIGTLSSRLTVEGPVKKGKGAFMISGRRTYADFFFRNLSSQALEANSLYFYDINGRFDYRFSKKNSISVSGYLGRDRFGFENLFRNSWGNQNISVRWNYIINPKLFSNMTFYSSSFRTKNTVDLVQGLGYISRQNLRHTGVKQDFSFFINPDTQLDFGYDINWQRYFFGEIIPIDETSIINQESIDPFFAVESAGYVSLERNFGDKLRMSLGMRYSRFDNIGPGKVYIYDVPEVVAPETTENNIIDSLQYAKGEVMNTYDGLEPRLAFRFLFSPSNSVKLSYSRTRQYLNQLSNTNTPSPVDMWAPVNRHIAPQIGDQAALGFFQNLYNNSIEASVEGYYKYMQNQADFKPLANLLLNDHLETELLQGTGRAYGVELMVRKKKGRSTGWASYMFSKSERETAGINNGQPYPTSFDRRHDVSLVYSYQLNKRINLSANWIYSSGVAYTFPVGKYEKDGFIVPYYSSRNGFRLPSTHRLDLAVTFYRKMSANKKNESSFNFSIYNAYNRKNTYAYVFRQSEDDRSQTEVVKLYLFTILPSFTYNFRF